MMIVLVYWIVQNSPRFIGVCVFWMDEIWNEVIGCVVSWCWWWKEKERNESELCERKKTCCYIFYVSWFEQWWEASRSDLTCWQRKFSKNPTHFRIDKFQLLNRPFDRSRLVLLENNFTIHLSWTVVSEFPFGFFFESRTRFENLNQLATR
jgi:hypothetical protein